MDTLRYEKFEVGKVRDLTTSELGLLDRFESHQLADLPEESLMNRVDKKFVIPRVLLCDLLLYMREGYTALELDGKRLFRYSNTYYDSDAYDLYLDHHNGKSNRYKIRYRTYVDSDTTFLEVKFKNNKNRTLKTRMRLNQDEQDIDIAKSDFLTENGVADHVRYKPTQLGSYSRIALANHARSERITVDTDLIFTDVKHEQQYELGLWVVVEVKQSRQNRDSRFFQWAQKQGIRKSKFSKYCMGIYFTGPSTLKRNNFHCIARQLKILPFLTRLTAN